ncbi:hypothetical protein [Deinococcus yavapaiensis]|uniref:Uncharacterized protein n=1 Tax=Deinococcus yavapaiensis KR-236 TaxID=694435 RepID=A0A318S2I7_9DEIO|nr:hypothetical protein [Deinococcus yavapaiensis]PYE51044.1 hypothetical protein DES52_116111 [Deinococcus yavapaiensis KR-236]
MDVILLNLLFDAQTIWVWEVEVSRQLDQSSISFRLGFDELLSELFRVHQTSLLIRFNHILICLAMTYLDSIQSVADVRNRAGQRIRHSTSSNSW